MLKHVVMWTMKDEALNNDKDANAKKLMEMLNNMVGKIDALLSLETGKNCTKSPYSYDVVLITTHKNEQGLLEYRDHPIHQEVAGFVGEVTKDRTVVDFEY